MKTISSTLNNQTGVSAVLLALTLVALMGFAALAVDLGYLYSARNELQNAADAAALAGARELGLIYSDPNLVPPGSMESFVLAGDQLMAVQAAASGVAFKNVAAGANVTLANDDIEIGRWSGVDLTDSAPPYVRPDAVRVTARRQEEANRVTTFFARALGIPNAGVSAVATAALSGQSEIDAGGLPIPVGISRYWFEARGQFCGQDIRFYPTGDDEGCAGWHTYENWPASADRLRGILNGLIDGTFESPATEIGDDYVFIGGNLATAFEEMQALYNANQVDGIWETSVVIYSYEELNRPCANPSGRLDIVGFATVQVYEVLGPPTQTIRGRVVCDRVEQNSRGGGGYYGTMGSIPGLVQ
jgi:hypothetical protein